MRTPVILRHEGSVHPAAVCGFLPRDRAQLFVVTKMGWYYDHTGGPWGFPGWYYFDQRAGTWWKETSLGWKLWIWGAGPIFDGEWCLVWSTGGGDVMMTDPAPATVAMTPCPKCPMHQSPTPMSLAWTYRHYHRPRNLARTRNTRYAVICL